MAVSGPNVGFGAAITFQTSFCAFITNIDWDGIERSVIETTNDSTTNSARTYLPGKVYDPGTVTVDLLLDNNQTFITAMTAVAETVTVTFPKFGSQTTAGTWACSGFLKSYKAGIPMDDKITGTAVIKLTGQPTITAGS